jgi:hypothetical protein
MRRQRKIYGPWLAKNYRWDDHRTLIDNLNEPYDAMRCPVTGGVCPAA